MTQTYEQMTKWAEQNEKNNIKQYIVSSSAIVLNEYTIEAESKEQAKDKWEQGDYIGFERKEEVSEQFEGVKENERYIYSLKMESENE